MHFTWMTVDQKSTVTFPVHHRLSMSYDIPMASNKWNGRNEHGWAILSNDWQIETAFRA